MEEIIEEEDNSIKYVEYEQLQSVAGGAVGDRVIMGASQFSANAANGLMKKGRETGNVELMASAANHMNRSIRLAQQV